ncbi:MAG: HAD-IIB family hydrolase [bacterium]|nr:HAD-IIB family hydrolase [bacterium]
MENHSEIQSVKTGQEILNNHHHERLETQKGKELLLLDFDVTICRPGQPVEKEIIKYLKLLNDFKPHIHLGLVSSNIIEIVLASLDEAAGLFSFVFAENGLIQYDKNGTIESFSLEKNLVSKVEKFAKAHAYSSIYFLSDKVYPGSADWELANHELVDAWEVSSPYDSVFFLEHLLENHPLHTNSIPHTMRRIRNYRSGAMNDWEEAPPELLDDIKIIFSDFDGTLTENGMISGEVYNKLWSLHTAGYNIIITTGRSAGWCDMIARTWPVSGVVGENGAFFMWRNNNKVDILRFDDECIEFKRNTLLNCLKEKYPWVITASDQPYRIHDIAINISEDDIHSDQQEINDIRETFDRWGYTSKISSIHISGWNGNFNKYSTLEKVSKSVFHWSREYLQKHSLFIGDSPNDEKLFRYLPNTVGVANILDFKSQLAYFPAFVSSEAEGKGFIRVADKLLNR